MIDPELAAFAAAGRALIVGCVDGTGAPHATRGWGFRLPCDDDTVAGDAVVILDRHDLRGVDCLESGRPVAVTASDVRSLRSVQFKGASVAVAPVAPADDSCIAHYLDEFIEAIADTDGIAPSVIQRMVPAGFVACHFTVAAVFDQTPGPRAGTPLAPVS